MICVKKGTNLVQMSFRLLGDYQLNPMSIIFTFLLVGLFFCAFSAQPYKKLIHNTDPDAKCLDGSSPMIYLHEGGDTKKFVFYFIGGGACMGNDLPSTLESCYRRSKGKFGSSKAWSDTYDAAEGGILAVDPSKSRFANWTKIVIMYCDGAFHQGNNKSPIQYKDTQLFFRGALNTRSHIKWADNKYNLSKAERIVVSGSSAGGMATYLWVDYFRTLVPDPKIVYGVSDSGIFYDPLVKRQLSIQDNGKYLGEMFANAEKSLFNQDGKEDSTANSGDSEDPNPVQILMQLSNVDEVPPNKECSGILTKEEHWKCIFIQFSYPTLRFPILFVEASYDLFVIQDALEIKCLKQGVSGYTPKDCNAIQMNEIQLYRSLYIDKFVPNLLKWGHSLWSISCVWHAEMINSAIYDSELQRVPKGDGPRMRTAVEEFVFDHKRIVAVDLFPWPANTPCAY